jgi:hypothetical protein
VPIYGNCDSVSIAVLKSIMDGRPSVEATGLELVKALSAAILPSCAAAKVFSHRREGEMTRLQCALVAGAITLGFIVVGSLCPTMLGGEVGCASYTSQSDFQILSFGSSP